MNVAENYYFISTFHCTFLREFLNVQCTPWGLLIFLIAFSKELCQKPFESPNKLDQAFLPHILF